MKVLVIGAAGFVGRALIASLAATAGIESLLLVDQHDFALPAGAPNWVIKKIGDFAEPTFRQSILADVQAVVLLAAVLGGAGSSRRGAWQSFKAGEGAPE